MRTRKTISYPGSIIIPLWKKALCSPQVLILCLLFLIGLCILFLQPYYGVPEPIITAHSENIHVMHSEPTSIIVPQQTEIPFQIPLLVNEKNPLPPGYVPQNLVLLDSIETSLFTVKAQNMMLDSETGAALTEMLKAAHADGITIWQISDAYRSAADQPQICNLLYIKTFRNTKKSILTRYEKAETWDWE